MPKKYLWSPRQLRISLLLVFIAIGAWFYMHLNSGERPQNVNNNPEVVLYDVDAVETDANGKPLRILKAEVIKHFDKQQRAELTNPVLTLFQADQGKWMAGAKTGILYSQTNLLQLRNDVWIEREPDANNSALRMETSVLNVWKQPTIAVTDQPVKVINEGNTVLAKGMRVDYQNARQADFSGRVNARLLPAETKDESTPKPQE